MCTACCIQHSIPWGCDRVRVPNETRNVCMWTPPGVGGCGSSIDVRSTHVCIPQETSGPDLSSWSPTVVPQSTAAVLELRNGPTVPGEPPPLGFSPLRSPHSTRWEAQCELSRELVGSRSQESPLWLWTTRAATPATAGSMYFPYNTQVMPPQLDRYSAELECSGTPWRACGGPSSWFHMDFGGTKPGFI